MNDIYTKFCFPLLWITFVKSEMWNLDIDSNLLAIKIRNKMDEVLRTREMQAYLDRFPVKETNIDEDTLKKITLVGDKFQTYIEAIRRLRDSVVAAYQNPESSEIAKNCCDYSGSLILTSGFTIPVDVNATCRFKSNFTPDDAFYIPQAGFLNQARKNQKKIPTLKWQYFASDDGAHIHYPASALSTSKSCLLTSRHRPWYSQAVNSIPQEVVIAIDKSGSMNDFHQDKSLIEIAVKAAKFILGTLSPRDKFAVMAFGVPTETIRDKFGDDTCFSYILAQATQVNIERAIEFLDNLEPQGGTFYQKGIHQAFHFYEKDFETDSEKHYQRVVMFFSDGSTDDNKEDVLTTAREANKALNNSVVIMTYAIGHGDTDILEELPDSNPNPRKKGKFKRLTDHKSFLKEISSYYKQFAISNESSADPIWTEPYLDSFFLVQVSTASLPVFVNNEFVGVVGIDAVMEDLFGEIMFFKPNENSYAFAIDGTGLVVHHPLLPFKNDTDAIYVLATALEPDEGFLPVFESMKRGESGRKTFLASRFATLGVYTNSPMKRNRYLSTYIWRKVSSANFSICFVLAVNESYVLISSDASVPPESFLYHRLDVVPPLAQCRHLNVISSLNESSVSLAARCFKNPERFLFRVFSEDDLKSMAKFMEGKGNDTIGIKDVAKLDVILTHYAFELWANASPPESLKHLLWRYIGTQHGVFRIFPAAQMPDNFDPESVPWFRYALAQENNFISSSREWDLLTQAPVITFHQALYIEKSNEFSSNYSKETFGVMTVAFLIHELEDWMNELYSKWLDLSNMTLYMIDTNANIIWPEKNRVNSQKLSHLVEEEPQIAKLLITSGILQRLGCAVIDVGLLQRQYKVKLTSPRYTISYKTTDGNMCFGLSLSSVERTDLFILLISSFPVDCTEDHVTVAEGSCSCPPKKCKTTWVKKTECECPCLDRNPYTTLCTNEYDFSRPDALRCSPKPKSFRKFNMAKTDISKLPICYMLWHDTAKSNTLEIVIAATSSTVAGMILVVGISALLYLYHKDIKGKQKVGQSEFYNKEPITRSSTNTIDSTASRRSTADDIPSQTGTPEESHLPR